jgi:hypothetical protein
MTDNNKIKELEEENNRLRRLVAQLTGGQQIVERPADWGEGPDPSHQSFSPSVQQQAIFFDIVKEDSIDMAHLNNTSSSFVQHFAAIKEVLQRHLLSLLKDMHSYNVYLVYHCRMSRSQLKKVFFCFM